MSYQEVYNNLNKGLYKEAAPRWLKQIVKLVRTGKKDLASSLASRLYNSPAVSKNTGYSVFLKPLLENFNGKQILTGEGLGLLNKLKDKYGWLKGRSIFRQFKIRDLKAQDDLSRILQKAGFKPFSAWSNKLVLSDAIADKKGYSNIQAFLQGLKKKIKGSRFLHYPEVSAGGFYKENPMARRIAPNMWQDKLVNPPNVLDKLMGAGDLLIRDTSNRRVPSSTMSKKLGL